MADNLIDPRGMSEREAQGFARLLELTEEDGWTYDVIVRDDGTAVVRVTTADGFVMGDVS